MTTRHYRTTLHPLAGYEPHPRKTDSPTGIPAQQRPHGQLSLRPPEWQHQVPPKATFDHDKLATILRAMVEVYSGNRDLRQLRHALHPDVAQQLATPVRTPGRSYILKSVHASSSTDSAIEACGTVQHGTRALAICARFDRVDGGWLCTEFSVMEPRKR